MYYEVAISRASQMKTHFCESSEDIDSGERVIIRLNGRKCKGYVIGRTEEPPPNSLNQIVERIDGYSFVDAALVETLVWAGRRYNSPIGRLFDIAVPKCIDRYAVSTVLPLSSFIGLEKMPLRSFISKYGEGHLKKLIQSGYVKIQRIPMAKEPHPRLQNESVELCVTLQEALHVVKDPIETQVANYLFINDEVYVDDIVRDLGVSKRVLSDLQKKGLIRIGPKVQRTDEKNVLDDSLGFYLEQMKRDEILLLGSKSSGKTDLCIEMIRRTVQKGFSALYLVPEAMLVGQVSTRLKNVLGHLSVGIYHSYLSEARRAFQWIQAWKGKISVVVGTRSAVFCPLRNLGLIVIEHEEDESYYQYENPVYDAVEVARRRAKLSNARVVMVSTTPRLDHYKESLDGKIQQIELQERRKCSIRVLNTRKEKSFVAGDTMTFIRSTLKSGRGVIIVVRRKGYSPWIQCAVCGFIVECPKCDVSLSYHRDENVFKCHLCGYTEEASDKCPRCGARALYPRGAGTERIEQHLKRRFASYELVRLDRDTVRHPQMVLEYLRKFERGEIDIIVGTKMITRGIDLDRAGLIVVMDFDGLLNVPDFTARFRTFRVLFQTVSESAGFESGTAVVQTYNPDNELLNHLVDLDVHGFYKEELAKRKEALYPPFTNIIQVILKARIASKGLEIVNFCSEKLRSAGEHVLGPVEHPIFRIANEYRFHFLIKTDDVETSLKRLNEVLTESGKRGWKVLLNPPALI